MAQSPTSTEQPDKKGAQIEPGDSRSIGGRFCNQAPAPPQLPIERLCTSMSFGETNDGFDTPSLPASTHAAWSSRDPDFRADRRATFWLCLDRRGGPKQQPPLVPRTMWQRGKASDFVLQPL